MKCITLLTDFGTADGYVGEMKGVLLAAVPTAHVVDITHDIGAHDVELGRLAVTRYWRRFPHGTVHIAIVDPGVGSERAALAVASDGRFLVGPDNGILSSALLLHGARAVRIRVPRTASATFHGRDVFAPAAAQLANGVALESLGEPADTPVIHRTPEPRRRPSGETAGQVIAIDRFGNAITNLPGDAGAGDVLVAGQLLPRRRTYAELREGEPGAIVGSAGLIEIALREGRAADALRLKRGDEVVLREG
jgi:S-adenosyl-L-methionine hydrolase (adenosine-forming)